MSNIRTTIPIPSRIPRSQTPPREKPRREVRYINQPYTERFKFHFALKIFYKGKEDTFFFLNIKE